MLAASFVKSQIIETSTKSSLVPRVSRVHSKDFFKKIARLHFHAADQSWGRGLGTRLAWVKGELASENCKCARMSEFNFQSHRCTLDYQQ